MLTCISLFHVYIGAIVNEERSALVNTRFPVSVLEKNSLPIPYPLARPRIEIK